MEKRNTRGVAKREARSVDERYPVPYEVFIRESTLQEAPHEKLFEKEKTRRVR